MAQGWQQPGLPFPPTMILSWSLEVNPFLLLSDHMIVVIYHIDVLTSLIQSWPFWFFGKMPWEKKIKRCQVLELGVDWNITHECNDRASYTKESLTNLYCTWKWQGQRVMSARLAQMDTFLLYSFHILTPATCLIIPLNVNVNAPRTPAVLPRFPASCLWPVFSQKIWHSLCSSYLGK